MKGLEVVLLPDEIQRFNLTDKLVVVIDILRASSTIVTALSEGAKRIIPVYSIEDALKQAHTFNPGEVLLAGERDGKKITGFTLGNSPFEYKKNIVKEKTLILSTTNGVKAIERVKQAKRLIIGSFLNATAVAQCCLDYSGEVLLVCSGDRGALSLEDAVCAGMIAEICKQVLPELEFRSDDCIVAFQLYEKFKNDFLKMMKESIWGKHLAQMGLEKDLVYCSQRNIYSAIPIGNVKSNAIFYLDKYNTRAIYP